MIWHENSPTHLVVVHYHLRPGGVRRVIELVLPDIVATMPSLRRLTFIVGESSDAQWIQSLRSRLRSVEIIIHVNACAGYFSEVRMAPASIAAELKTLFAEAISPNEETVVWAHNLGLARNLHLASELSRIASRPHTRLVSHHHDLWFENRWNRWPEFTECGVESLDAVADIVLSASARVCHAMINRRDFRSFRGFPRTSVGWLANPLAPKSDVSIDETRSASSWLRSQLGDGNPIWIAPTRFLRRKNLPESILLSRWMCPGGWLITTAGPSSADEKRAYETLSRFVDKHKLRVRFGLLAEARDEAPGIGSLIAASDAVIATSIQEGFGLPYLEAANAGKPLIARRLPNTVSDLKMLGHSMSNTYAELWIHPSLIDAGKEISRQNADWEAFLERIPHDARKLAGAPWIRCWRAGTPLAFSRLTLAGQLEILSVDPQVSWRLSRRWNPSLCRIANRADSASMLPDVISPYLSARLSAETYAQSFWHLAACCSTQGTREARAIHQAMLTMRLAESHLFPVLW